MPLRIATTRTSNRDSLRLAVEVAEVTGAAAAQAVAAIRFASLVAEEWEVGNAALAEAFPVSAVARQKENATACSCL